MQLPKLPKTARAVWDSFGQCVAIGCYSHARFRDRPTSVRLVLANQTPPFLLIRVDWKWRTWNWRTWNWRTRYISFENRLHYNAVCNSFQNNRRIQVI